MVEVMLMADVKKLGKAGAIVKSPRDTHATCSFRRGWPHR